MSAVLLTVFGLNAQNNISAAQVLANAVNKCGSSKGIEAHFNINNSGYTGNGSLKAAGGKFIVKLPDAEVWYNGKEMYTYNKGAGETTVVIPTAEELSQSNPLNYILTAQKNYNVSFSTVKKNGKYVLELTPKQKGAEIKRLTLTLRKTDFIPEKIVVEPSSGSPIVADISSFKTDVTVSASDFEYPRSKYSKVELIDLR